MQPTKERNHPAALLTFKSEGILVDCGENTQRQLKIAGISPARITKILISHWHSDHVLGLPGLLQTMGANEYPGVVKIYGPKGTKERIDYMFKAFVFDVKVKFKIVEIEPGKFFENEDFYLECLPLDHGIVCYGYRFTEKDRRKINVGYVEKLGIPEGPLLGKLQKGETIEWKGKKVLLDEATYVVPGKKIAFVCDTLFCNNCIELAREVDVLVSEAAFTSEHQEKAEAYMHMTAKHAAEVANRAQAKKLVLTHFSQRYKTNEEIEEDAKQIFSNVVCAQDFMHVKI